MRDGHDLRYHRYDWEQDAGRDWFEQPRTRLVVVEGVRLLRPRLMPYFDLTVWIDCSVEAAAERGKSRDRGTQAGAVADIDAHMARWDADWIPKDLDFERVFDPARRAELVVTASADHGRPATSVRRRA